MILPPRNTGQCLGMSVVVMTGGGPGIQWVGGLGVCSTPHSAQDGPTISQPMCQQRPAGVGSGDPAPQDSCSQDKPASLSLRSMYFITLAPTLAPLLRMLQLNPLTHWLVLPPNWTNLNTEAQKGSHLIPQSQASTCGTVRTVPAQAAAKAWRPMHPQVGMLLGNGLTGQPPSEQG